MCASIVPSTVSIAVTGLPGPVTVSLALLGSYSCVLECKEACVPNAAIGPIATTKFCSLGDQHTLVCITEVSTVPPAAKRAVWVGSPCAIAGTYASKPTGGSRYYKNGENEDSVYTLLSVMLILLPIVNGVFITIQRLLNSEDKYHALSWADQQVPHTLMILNKQGSSP